MAGTQGGSFRLGIASSFLQTRRREKAIRLSAKKERPAVHAGLRSAMQTVPSMSTIRKRHLGWPILVSANTAFAVEGADDSSVPAGGRSQSRGSSRSVQLFIAAVRWNADPHNRFILPPPIVYICRSAGAGVAVGTKALGHPAIPRTAFPRFPASVTCTGQQANKEEEA